MKLRLLLIFTINVLISMTCFGQNVIDLKARFDIEKKQILISETIQYYNATNDTLHYIYLNDWNNSYATKHTQLAQRIADEYKNDFHLAKNEERGFSVITSIKQDNDSLSYHSLKNQIDIVKVKLNKPLEAHTSYTIKIENIVQIPSDKFTEYGITKTKDLNLRYWYITPAVYDGKWQYYSNKGLDDMYIPLADVSLNIEIPSNYFLASELEMEDTFVSNNKKIFKLKGNSRNNNKLFISQSKTFKNITSNELTFVSNIDEENLEPVETIMIKDKVSRFLIDKFGNYPHKKLLLSQIDYNKNPIYGLNFLPSFIKTYPNHFQYELKILKISLLNYLENTLIINPREEQWLIDAIMVYYLMDYIDEYYPDMKFLGSIANIWGVRSFHAADMKFNDKYILAYMIMARTNRDQPLTTSKDSLIKFNANIANKYKAGVGLKYLDDFVNSDVVESSIETFVKENKLKQTSTKAFETFIKSKTHKNIDWFFTDYINTRKKIDFKIEKVIKGEDSITITIKNKRDNHMPISLYTLNNDSILSKIWIEDIQGKKSITIPKTEANKLVLNYNNVIPEINLRDNWKSLKGFFFNNKPLQFRLFQDIEDPNYNQVFFMPLVEFNNIYDGLTLGVKAYNKTLLRKRFNYKIAPQYSLKSGSLTGSGNASITQYFDNTDLFAINYGVIAGYQSYAQNLFVKQITPSVSFYFRESDDLRSNKRRSLIFRYLSINRDRDLDNILTTTEPNYNVFDARYIYSNDNLIRYSKWYADFQLSKTFSKVAFNYEYRRLFENNRQLNLRFFTGAFIENKNDPNSNYFSFALDRPTDYLFEYPYLGRSEASGIFSQQYITAEGGFKSKLNSPFANQWISTMNTSTTLWKYILAYGDIGVVKNKWDNAKFVYDSGIRVDLVTDYFEIYFPVYSNLGWEIGQPHYDQKIRFKFTLDPEVLLGLFRRRWY
ncbi:gluzincin family metallopeptidase [Siansivirga zeaxanthinifaciens]|uniref:Metalloprotease n=1 Tax=Siansivirga zeaxanthinifaciens CC-SAMT-1 TaxID=1454006 RepID=A0A0C5VZ51_9FLAO|nr:metalloprotease [Siansivirga zeaxanthinifaciens]AJR04326.1 metalloprotease [Siansivirga zeaxanthinifaciens CC-SAMT-1]